MAVLASLSSISYGHFIWCGLDTNFNAKFSISETPGVDTLPLMERLGTQIQIISKKLSKSKGNAETSRYSGVQIGEPVLAFLPYGMVKRGGENYLLEYYAKAVWAPTDASKVVGKGFELIGDLL